MKEIEEIRMIWTNDPDPIYEDLKTDPEYEDRDNEELWDIAQELASVYLDDEVENLDIDKDNDIILMGTLYRWNGAYSVYKELETNNIGEALKKALAAFEGHNSFNIYVKGNQLFISQTSHDNPVNPSIMEFRVLTTDIDDLPDDKPDTLRANTKPLGRDIGEIYGWEAA